MKTRIGPFSLRLPVKINVWLESAAKDNNRSVTNETIYCLNMSLKKVFSEQDVTHFKQTSPTTLNNEVVGVRLPADIKQILKGEAKRHSNSLNQEIVMRLVDVFESGHNNDKTRKKNYASKYESGASYILTPVEADLLKSFRNLDNHSKSLVIKLVKNL